MKSEREGDGHSSFTRIRKWSSVKEEVEKTHLDLQELKPSTMEEEKKKKKKKKKKRTPSLSPWRTNTQPGGLLLFYRGKDGLTKGSLYLNHYSLDSGLKSRSPDCLMMVYAQQKVLYKEETLSPNPAKVEEKMVPFEESPSLKRYQEAEMGMERTPQRRITIILARRMSCSFAAPPPPLPELRCLSWTHPQSKLNIKATQRSQDLKKRLYLQLSFIDFYSGRKKPTHLGELIPSALSFSLPGRAATTQSDPLPINRRRRGVLRGSES
ncbi:hypothetical protein JHK82_024571 [Glycine max]|nr:hypothetical protein JHK82_024571 [Glycine max]